MYNRRDLLKDMEHAKVLLVTTLAVPTAQGKRQKRNVRDNTGNLEILPKHREFCLHKGKFPDSKDTGYCEILEVFEVSFAPEVAANFGNWHMKIFQLDRENGFEWGPCLGLPIPFLEDKGVGKGGTC